MNIEANHPAPGKAGDCAPVGNRANTYGQEVPIRTIRLPQVSCWSRLRNPMRTIRATGAFFPGEEVPGPSVYE